jgi:hypothetical protein
MHFTDDEATEVKAWVVKKLEDMYVRALDACLRESLVYRRVSYTGFT